MRGQDHFVNHMNYTVTRWNVRQNHRCTIHPNPIGIVNLNFNPAAFKGWHFSRLEITGRHLTRNHMIIQNLE